MLLVQRHHLGRVLCGGDGAVARTAQQAFQQQHVGGLVVHDEQLGFEEVRCVDHAKFI